jgi:hypothetical protein
LIDALRLLFALILYFIILFFDSHKLTIPLRVFFENSKRQKLIGLRSKASPGLPADSVTIADLVLKKNEINKVILIGTPEEVLEEFLKSSKEFTSKDDVVFNDLDYDYLPISDENFVRDLEERKRRLEQVIAKVHPSFKEHRSVTTLSYFYNALQKSELLMNCGRERSC